MLIIGAGGLARELLLCAEENEIPDVAFFDNLSLPQKDLLYNKFPILHTNDEVLSYWKHKSRAQFHVGIGNPELRYKMVFQFESLGGELVSLISKKAVVGTYDVAIENGVTIMQQAIISNSTTIGKGSLIYYNSAITHDVHVAEFCEISPGALLLGGCKIGAYTQIGAGAIILPKITIGKRSIVGAGSVVRNDIPDNSLVAGVPAVIKRKIQS